MPQTIRPMPAKPADTAQLPEKIAWLIDTHGYDPRADRVVMLYEPSAYCNMTLAAFRALYMSWFEEEQRKEKGKPTRVYATAAWLLSGHRPEIAGVRMRPDKSFPCYLEDGRVFKNTYRQPQHEAVEGADIQPFLDYLERFLPAEVEREHWLNWAAHKWQRPEVPGAALVYVADTQGGPLTGKYGTGRSFIDRILHKLLGEAYCRSEDFEMLTGTSGQADYTDWLSDCILITIDEAHTSPTAYRKGEKRSVYTALKKYIDPAPKRRTFRAKYRQAFDGMSYCSFTVATNHANAAAIPKNDRRLSVLCNGREMHADRGRGNRSVDQRARLDSGAGSLSGDQRAGQLQHVRAAGHCRQGRHGRHVAERGRAHAGRLRQRRRARPGVPAAVPGTGDGGADDRRR